MDGEDQKAQDARVKELWDALDTKHEGRLNLNGLKKGLNKINHRKNMHLTISSSALTLIALKNADSLLHDVLHAVDSNGDEHIEFEGTFSRC